MNKKLFSKIFGIFFLIAVVLILGYFILGMDNSSITGYSIFEETGEDTEIIINENSDFEFINETEFNSDEEVVEEPRGFIGGLIRRVFGGGGSSNQNRFGLINIRSDLELFINGRRLEIGELLGGRQRLGLNKNGLRIAEFDIIFDRDIDLSELFADVNFASNKAFIHRGSISLENVELYIPRGENQNGVRICSNASSFEEIYSGCSELESITEEYSLTVGDSNLRISDDGKYFIVSGITGTGGEAIYNPINISECGIIDSSGFYSLNQSIESTETCLIISANDVHLDCKGYTITYNTDGISTRMGIDAVSGTNPRTNLTIQNCVLIKPTDLQTEGYGIKLTRFSDSRLINNTIYTNGTTNNYGIFLTTNSNNNLIENNIIYSSGTSTGNTGIYVFSGSTDNILRNNFISTSGTANSHGVYLSTNTSFNKIIQNNIITNAETTSHGVYLFGALNAPANENKISNNSISTDCSGPSSSCYGLFLQNLVSQNKISENNILTQGTENDFGIYLFGTPILPVDSNIIEMNRINVSGADLIRINIGSKNNSLINNTLINNNHSYYDINILANSLIGTHLIDQEFNSYHFAGAGERIKVKRKNLGEIEFTDRVTGSGANFRNKIVILENYVYVNSSSQGLNKSAIITFYNLDFSHPIILRDGDVCLNCEVLSNEEGTIRFSVPHFSGYSIGENSLLEIFDNSDLEDFYGGTLKFYANYTNRTDSQPILSAECNLIVNESSYLIDYNANTLLYEYSLDFFDIGTFEYSVNCSHDNFSELDAADTFTILPPEGSKLPSGAQVDVIKSERANLAQELGNHSAQAGNVTQLDIFSNTITRSWQGYYGNVSGAISLGDLDGNVLYNWSAVNPTGQVYATRAFDVNFATTKCANELEISSEEEFIGHNSSDADSVTNTFNQNNHPHFSVGLINIGENSCKSTNLFDENGNQITKFFNTLLSDGASNIIYGSILEQSERGFDGRNHDFQLIVGENGRDELTTNYYFYVEVI